MKFFRLDLLTLLISLFILNSCKNQDTIGLGVINATNVTGSLIDTSTIIVNTVAEDTTQTSGLAYTPLSFLKDPLLGTTEANVAIDLNLPSSTIFTLPTGTVTVDSALLVLRYAKNGFYGDSIASRYKANVYQLNERLLSSVTYYNTKTWLHSNVLLGTKNFFSRTGDSLLIVNPILNVPDTAIKVPPQLRIPISTAFVRSILFDAPSQQLGSNLVFKNNVKGLYITLDKNQTGPGGTFMLALDSAAAIQIYYRNFNGTVTDTSLITLPSTLHAAEIRHTPSAIVQTELNNTTTNRKTAYVQGLGGLRTKISFPYLKNIIKNLGSDVIVNRAELVITAAPGTTIPFSPLPKLSIYRFDLAHQRVFIQDTGGSGDPRTFSTSGGFYNIPEQNYHFLVTAYIQDLMRGASEDLGTFIAPASNLQGNTSTGASPIDVTAQVDGRSVIVGYDKASPYRVKLNIFYTKIAK